MIDAVEQAHSEACNRDLEFYRDPYTGLLVMTADYLRSRGWCCRSGCRHCPYGNDKQDNRKN